MDDQWRLKAYREWKAMDEPDWANVNYNKPDYQAISYYSAQRKKINTKVWMKLIQSYWLHLISWESL